MIFTDIGTFQLLQPLGMFQQEVQARGMFQKEVSKLGMFQQEVQELGMFQQEVQALGMFQKEVYLYLSTGSGSQSARCPYPRYSKVDDLRLVVQCFYARSDLSTYYLSVCPPVRSILQLITPRSIFFFHSLIKICDMPFFLIRYVKLLMIKS